MIDVHVHYWKHPDYLEKLLIESERLGIKKLCLSTSGDHYGQVDNAAIKKAFEQFPDKIFGFGYVHLGTDTPDLVDKLHKQGFRGLKVIRPAANYDDKMFYPFYEKAQGHEMPILFHTGIVLRTKNDLRGDVSSARMRPIYLDTIARAFPELNIIGAHLGTPWLEEACMVTRINPNVYFDITGSPYGGWRTVMKPGDWHRLFYWDGAFEKIMFGTDVEVEHMEKAVRIYEEVLSPLGLSQSTLDRIYTGNIAEILGIG